MTLSPLNHLSRFIFLSIIVLLLGSCDHKTRNCTAITGLDPLLEPGQILLIGEIHGTNEGPANIHHIACNALANGLKVTIGLELLQKDQQVIDDYLISDGSLKDKEKILNLDFWSREYQDGRASQAMFQLIEDIRELKHSGENIELMLVDDPSYGNRNKAMAHRIVQEATGHPERFIIVLTGNYHSMIWKGSGQMGEFVIDALGSDRVVSLILSYTGGTAWVDIAGEGYGPIELEGSGMLPTGIYLDKSLGDYHGKLEIDSIHFSRPARELLSY